MNLPPPNARNTGSPVRGAQEQACDEIVIQAKVPARRHECDKEMLACSDSRYVTADQVSIRWHLQLGSVPSPTVKQAPRRRQLLDVFGFESSREETATISSNSQPAPNSVP